MFSKTSRYAAVGGSTYLDVAGRTIVYKLLRVIPTPAADLVHVVTGGDRLDLLASTYYRDPEQFWRICDANSALLPSDLTAVYGRALGIPLSVR